MDPRGEDDTVAATDPQVALAGVEAGMAAGDLIAHRYRITRYLGGGGMGNVYAAVDAELGEPLAIKLLRRGLTDDAVERFRTEVRLQRRITHRNVARIFDIGDHGGEKLLTMELVDGESLAARITRLGAMPLPELRAVAFDILAGLSAAHAAGVVHLDLKPGNVLLARDGRAVIADFGIARAGCSVAGQIAGTPGYMAPEQHAGAGDLDARADVYAFGVMLFELATGRRPFGDGKTLDQLALDKAAPPDPRELAPELPAALVAVIQRCLAPDRTARPTTADEVAAALDRALQDSAGSGVIALPIAGRGVGSLVAVLPVTAAPGDAYLATGLAEDVADALSRSPGLRVLPATAVRGMSATGIAAGAALGVDHVIEASIRRASGRPPTEDGRPGEPGMLRVAVRLVSVRDGIQIWADRRDTTEHALLATADELAEGLAGALSTAAAPRAEIDPRAVDLYLRARHNLRDFWGSSLRDSIAMLEEAARAAPSSPTIVSALASAHVRAWMLTGEADAATLARASADQAMAVGPFHGEARYARAQVRINSGDLVGGVTDLGTAIRLAPLHGEAHYTAGLMLCEVGQLDEGRKRFQHCVELDPGRQILVEADLARISALEGDWPEADRRLVDLAGTGIWPSAGRLAGLFRARLSMWRGQRYDVIPDVIEPVRRTNFLVDTLLGSIHRMVAHGGVDEPAWRAQFDLTNRPERPLRSRMVAIQILAEVAMADDRRDLALEGLECVAAIGLLDIVWLRHCPLWAPLVDEPRFGAVLAQVAARAQQLSAAYYAGLVGR